MSSKSNVIALKSILYKEVNRFMRIWVQTLVPPAITISLYFVIFGELIGSRIGQMGGFDYMSFIVPGLIMMSVITNSYSNVASSFFSAKWQRNVEEMLVAEEAMEETPAESTDGEAATGEEVVAAEGEVVPEGTEAE